jgi:hypothetical protein
VNTIAVSSAEVERAFLFMNNILTKKRRNLQIQRTVDLMTICLLGQPLELWRSSTVRKILVAGAFTIFHILQLTIFPFGGISGAF